MKNYTVSVIIPCKNERGTIEEAVRSCPKLGSATQLIFVEGNSQDGTQEEIKRVIKEYPKKDISLIVQKKRVKLKLYV
jgi:glycosyltransferase involved in cell wall biosynthesis